MKHRLLPVFLAVLVLLGCGKQTEEPAQKNAAKPPEASSVPCGTEEMIPAIQAAQTEPAPTETEPAETQPQEERFWLTFAGDCTFGSQDATYYAPWGFVKTVGEDYGYPFRNVMDWFGTDEFTMVNLEGVLGNATGKVEKAHNLHGPAEFAAILPQGSVEAVTLANNHTWDYGERGYTDTKTLLEEQKIPYVEKKSTLLCTTPNGLTVGIYAEEYTDMDMERLKAAIAELRSAGADIVVYALHWGKEYSYYPQPDQIDWAHQAVDAGVDILYGTHPHVLQLYEQYNGKPIFYSLGNFSFGGNMYPGDLDSVLAQVEVIRSPEGGITLGQTSLIPVCISSVSENGRNNYQPTPYEEGSEGYQRTLDKLAGLWKGRDTR